MKYERILLSTGGEARRLPIEGNDLQNVLTLRSVTDLESLQKNLSSVKNVVVIGASFIGCETAATIKKEFKDQINVTVMDTI